MTVHRIIKTQVSGPAINNLEKVLAFHCSGGSPTHHRALDTLLGSGIQLDSPEYFGSRFRGPWYGNAGFSLADEASRTIQKMDVERCNSYHLVGHSYGGAVALHIARVRPELVKSLTLYEPCVFNLLKYAGKRGLQALQEITAMAEYVVKSIVKGDRRTAMLTFVDYWNEKGTWATLSDDQQNQLICWASKIPLEFNALTNENTPLISIDALRVPTKVIYGEYAPLPTYIGSIFLAAMLGNGHAESLSGAGHMGPLTHPIQVATLVKNHIEQHAIASQDKSAARTGFFQNQYQKDKNAA